LSKLKSAAHLHFSTQACLCHKILALNILFYPYCAEACCFNFTPSHPIHANFKGEGSSLQGVMLFYF
jgi:hypothetical protein